MKLLLGSILALALLCIGICIYKTYKESHPLARTVRRILALGFLIVLFNIVSLYTNYEWVCLFAYSVYFLCTNWMLYYLFRFSMEYIGRDFDKYVNRPFMLFLLSADTLSLALNNTYGHLFSINAVTVSGEPFYELIIKPAFYTHYLFVMMLVVFILISLFYGAVKAPVFYRKKYLTIGVILAVIVIINILTFRTAIDVSIIGYAVEAIAIYYCTFVFTPQKLLSTTLMEVNQQLSTGILVIDLEGAVLYTNNCADSLLNSEPPLVTWSGTPLNEWCRNKYLNTDEEFTKEFTFYKDGEEYTIKVQLQRIKDVKRQLQGGYFTLQDRTQELANLVKEKHTSSHDALTDFLNREAFYTDIKKHIKWNPTTTFLLVCTDIKDFKIINDFLGTAAGDSLLVNYAKMLKTHIKAAYTFGRLNNDIFAMLIPKDMYNDDLFPNRDEYNFFDDIDKDISFPIVDYIGVYEITEPTLPASVMCDRARMAINAIKGDLQQRFSHYDDHLRTSKVHEQELITDLKPALSEKQIQMHLQPQMSSEGKLLGAEALVRWTHPTKGMIMPGDFIPVFEKNGLISDVDMYIWESACELLKKWQDKGLTNLHISVNISPRDFYFLDIYQTFTGLVEKYGINPKNLRIEITETAVVMDFYRQMELINRLRSQGFIVEMDDFGSGYSSLNMLKDIYVDILKIDMAFLKKASDESRSRKILEMIINLSNNLGMPVITEGVETKEQVEFLTRIGCHVFQGYYFAKPMPVDVFEETYKL